MTVTLSLPPDIEQAFLGEAAAMGLTPDELVSEVLRSRACLDVGPADENRNGVRLHVEDGVPILRSGKQMALPVIAETIDAIRRERELSNFGSF